MDKIVATACNDALKACAKGFAGSAVEASTPEVRQAFLEMSQTAVRRQEQLTKLMEQRGWYTPVPARQQDVQRLLPELQDMAKTPAMV